MEEGDEINESGHMCSNGCGYYHKNEREESFLIPKIPYLPTFAGNVFTRSTGVEIAMLALFFCFHGIFRLAVYFTGTRDILLD